MKVKLATTESTVKQAKMDHKAKPKVLASFSPDTVKVKWAPNAPEEPANYGTDTVYSTPSETTTTTLKISAMLEAVFEDSPLNQALSAALTKFADMPTETESPSGWQQLNQFQQWLFHHKTWLLTSQDAVFVKPDLAYYC